MGNIFLVDLAQALSARGAAVLRFNFVYGELGSKRPDPPKLLLETYRAAAEALQHRAAEAFGGERFRLFLGGKSMGGRMATMLVANGFRCDGLVLLGYPLHPAGQPEKMRDGHLASVGAPMLFVQGTRDKLCDLTLLTPVLARLGDRAKLIEIKGGDHSFEVRKMDGRTHEEVMEQIVTGVGAFVAEGGS